MVRTENGEKIHVLIVCSINPPAPKHLLECSNGHDRVPARPYVEIFSMSFLGHMDTWRSLYIHISISFCT